MIPIFRIMYHPVRSARAVASLQELQICDVAGVEAQGADQRNREIACSLAHAKAMRAFLETSAEFGAVLEDDAILAEDRSWLTFREFDLFVPFARNRDYLPPVAEIRRGALPRFGAFAYLCSREFATRYIPRLMAGEIADHASHRAAEGLRVGSFVGNLVNHDNEAHSLVSEERRLAYLKRLKPVPTARTEPSSSPID